METFVDIISDIGAQISKIKRCRINQQTLFKLENDAQFEKLHQRLYDDLRTVHGAERLLGDGCFTSGAEENIRILNRLNALFEFSRTAEEFNQELQEMLDAVPDEGIRKKTVFYIKKKLCGE